MASELIAKVYEVIDYLTGMEGQDQGLTLECSQAMLNDVIERNALQPIVNYILRYVDCLDSPEEYAELAANFG